MPAPSPTPFLVHAIFVEATQHCDIRNNHIRDTGPVRSFPDNGNPLIAAIFVHNPLGGVQVTGNRVCYSDRSRLEVPRAALHIIRPGRSGTGFVEPLFPGGFKGNSLAFSDHAIILPDGTRPFQILGNHFESIRTNHPNGINDGVLINADALNLTFTGNFVQQTLASGNDIGQFLLDHEPCHRVEVVADHLHPEARAFHKRGATAHEDVRHLQVLERTLLLMIGVVVVPDQFGRVRRIVRRFGCRR